MAVNDDQFEKYVMGDAKNPPIEKDAEGDSAHSLGSGGGEDTAYTSVSASANKGLVRSRSPVKMANDLAQSNKAQARRPLTGGREQVEQQSKVCGGCSIVEQMYSISGSKSGKAHGLRWWHGIFFFSGISVFACLLQIFLPYPYGMMMPSADIAKLGIAPGGCEDGLSRCICPRKTVCATNICSMILLTLARCSAFFDYPLYMMMFLSKCHNLNNILRRTVLREFIGFADMHHIHSIFGVMIGVESMSHSFFHMLRWGINNEMYLLWDTVTGITGAIACAFTVFIVWPMFVPALKKHISFEVRKGAHYLVWVWALLLMWHAPSRIFWLIGVPFLVYVADFFVGIFVRTHLIENVYFERLGKTGVSLHFENPRGYSDSKTSYVYIMCPWISKWQWHAFTMFPEPTKKDHTMLCIGSSGDWTKELHDKIESPCHRSLFVIGPFASPISDMAVNTSNAIAIASGIGITPTLSLMQSYAGKKRINIIWMCRDAGLIEFIIHKFDITGVSANSFVVIFYTGDRELLLPKNLPVNFFIFRKRPNLEEGISGIVTAIASGEGLPEDIYDYQRAFADIPATERIKMAFGRFSSIYSNEEMFEYAFVATVKKFDAMELESCSESLLPSRRTFQVSRLVSAKTADKLVSVDGLEAMISTFLNGIGEYSRANIEDLFKLVDADSSGYIDRVEFDEFIGLAMGEDKTIGVVKAKSRLAKSSKFLSDLTAGMRGESDYDNVIMLGDDSTIAYMESMISDVKRPLDDWSMFYCGNSTQIVKTLQVIERKYHICLAIEKFDW